MPELAEIKIMAEYINSSCQDQDFTSISVSDAVASRLALVTPSDLQVFTIHANSRGKELKLLLNKGYPTEKELSISMGMSGYWKFCKENEERPKHTHLKFNTANLGSLCLVDARRFAKWRWKTESTNRGPCPVSEFEDFKKNIYSALSKKLFKKPIHILLMDQRYFNGIGNYLRAEILYRAGQDPFESADTAILNNPQILELCKIIPIESYYIGGGQLKDWKNPFEVQPSGFNEWIRCYGKSDSSIVDKNGRVLWYFKDQLNTSTYETDR